MIIDCESCTAEPSACDDCVVGVLLGGGRVADTDQETDPDDAGDDGGARVPSGASTLSLDAPERRALDLLADHGLVPRLRLVAPATGRRPRNGRGPAAERDAG